MRLFRRPPITDDAEAPRMEIASVDGLTVARQGKTIVAATTGAICLAEGTYPNVIYFPMENIDPAALLPVDGQTRCPWKGEANYFDILGSPRAAWTYYDAAEVVVELAGMVAFDPRYVDVATAPLPDVPDEARDVLAFWFEETDPDLHFKQDDSFDAQVRERFGGLLDKAKGGALDSWMKTPDGALALIILLDQFTRNIHRGEAEAFAEDKTAQALAATVVELGFDLALPEDRRAFAYLPFMHAEDVVLQNRSVALFTSRLPGSMNVKYALGHRDTFHRHGRFPGRDAARGL